MNMNMNMDMDMGMGMDIAIAETDRRIDGRRPAQEYGLDIPLR